MKVKKARAAELSDFEVLHALREMDKRQQTSIIARSEAAAQVNGNGNGIVGDANNDSSPLSIEERVLHALPPNLRTIQYEVLETLQNVQRPCAHQTPEQIPRFLDALAAWERGRPVEGVLALQSDENDGHPIVNNGGEADDDVTVDARQPTTSNASGGVSRGIIESERRLTKGERLMLVNHAPTTEIELYTLVEELESRFSAQEIADILAIVAAHLPLDHDAMRAEQNRADAEAAAAAAIEEEGVGGGGEGEGDVEKMQDGEQVYVGHDEGEEEIVEDEDMDMLENERAGGPAVDDEVPDE